MVKPRPGTTAGEGREMSMSNRMELLSRAALGLVAASALMGAPARAEDAVKVGLIVPMTGGQASTGKQLDNAVKLYMKQHGDTVAGKKIEIILKDDGAVPA